jgi:hypothetical protein
MELAGTHPIGSSSSSQLLILEGKKLRDGEIRKWVFSGRQEDIS